MYQAAKPASVYATRCRIAACDRSSLVYLGRKACSVHCPERDSASSDVAVPWRLAPRMQIHEEPGTSPREGWNPKTSQRSPRYLCNLCRRSLGAEQIPGWALRRNPEISKTLY